MRYLPPLELSATVQHAKIFDEGNTAVGLGAVWSLSPVWSAVAGVGFNSDATSYSAGLRWHLAAPAPAAAVATESSVPELEEPAAVVAADDPPAPPTPPASTAEAIAERPAVISPSAAPAAPAPSPLLGPSATGFYVGAGVKLRGRPTQNGNVLDVIDERAAAEVLASATNADGAWKLVRVGRVSGWIAASELQ